MVSFSNVFKNKTFSELYLEILTLNFHDRQFSFLSSEDYLYFNSSSMTFRIRIIKLKSTRLKKNQQVFRQLLAK